MLTGSWKLNLFKFRAKNVLKINWSVNRRDTSAWKVLVPDYGLLPESRACNPECTTWNPESKTVLVISMKKGKRLKIPSSEDYRNPRLSLITLYGATYFLSIQPADLECFRGVSTIYHSLFG